MEHYDQPFCQAESFEADAYAAHRPKMTDDDTVAIASDRLVKVEQPQGTDIARVLKQVERSQG